MRFAVTLSLVLVVCGFAAAQQSRSVIIQAPAANETVAKLDAVKGICAVKGAIPVVFVKPLDGTDWFVQEPTIRDGARFKCNAHFGEAESKGKFKIVVVAVPEEEVKGFSEGDKIVTLPDYPASDPVTPEDVAATIYHALGIDPHMPLSDSLGRPHVLALGRPITSLFG